MNTESEIQSSANAAHHASAVIEPQESNIQTTDR
jgi:hypothetical protein